MPGPLTAGPVDPASAPEAISDHLGPADGSDHAEAVGSAWSATCSVGR